MNSDTYLEKHPEIFSRRRKGFRSTFHLCTRVTLPLRKYSDWREIVYTVEDMFFRVLRLYIRISQFCAFSARPELILYCIRSLAKFTRFYKFATIPIV